MKLLWLYFNRNHCLLKDITLKYIKNLLILKASYILILGISVIVAMVSLIA